VRPLTQQGLGLGGDALGDVRGGGDVVHQAYGLADEDADLGGAPLGHGGEIGGAASFGPLALLVFVAVPAIHKGVAQHAAGEFGRPVIATGDIGGALTDGRISVFRQGSALVVGVDEAFRAGPEAGAEHDAIGAEHEGGGHAAPVRDAAGRDLPRAEQEAALARAIDAHAPEYVVLARYMRVLSESFVDRYPHRIVNIHHSFLPAFAGASPYRQAFDRGVKLIGATAHFVTPELDEGPIIAQDVIPVDHTYTPERMARAGRDVEKLVLARAVRLLLEERVFLHGRRTVVFG